MPSAYALGIVRGKIIFILDSEKSADFSESLFSRKGVVTENGSFNFYFCILESL